MKERFETFTALISKISRNIRKIKNREMAEYNLKGTHVSCIYYLYTGGGLTVTELAERCDEDKASISRALEFLENSGLACAEDSEKRYKCPISLTEKGKEIGEKVSKRVEIILGEAGVGLTEMERGFFYRILSSVSESLEKLANE